MDVGNGTLSWADENGVKQIDLERGDVYKLDSGSVFYMQSKRSDSVGAKLKVHAFFTSMSEDSTHVCVLISFPFQLCFLQVLVFDNYALFCGSSS